MTPDEFAELSSGALRALAKRWSAEGDPRGALVAESLALEEVLGEPPGFFEAHRGVTMLSPEAARGASSGLEREAHVARVRTLLATARFGVAEESGLEILYADGVPTRVVSKLRDAAGAKELARFLSHPMARLVRDVLLLLFATPTSLGWSEELVGLLRGKVVSPRCLKGSEGRPWIEPIAALPRLRFRISAWDPGHDFLWALQRREATFTELHVVLAPGSRALDFPMLEGLARRSRRLVLDAESLDVFAAREVLGIVSEGFGDGPGLVEHDRVDHTATLSTSFVTALSSPRPRVVRNRDGVLLRSPRGETLWRSDESPSFEHERTAYEWIPEGLSDHILALTSDGPSRADHEDPDDEGDDPVDE